MKHYLFGNWKCNPVSTVEAARLFLDIAKGLSDSDKVGAAIFPPFCYLPILSQTQQNIALGAQNCGNQEKGAFTGEVSAKQIADLGAKYVIVGHSERRKLYAENDTLVNEKAKIALLSGLTPVVCVGETDAERSAGRQNEVVAAQLAASLKDVDVSRVFVAYEPVWAIGTGKACSVEDAAAINKLIKETIGENVPLLYGGSANAENGTAYLREAGYSGLLVGGASLKAEEFAKMFKGIQGLG